MVTGAVAQVALWQRRGWSRLNKNALAQKLLSSAYTVPVGVFISYALLSLRVAGPAYLSDEVGYLAKAATLAGDTVHMATSWYGGYSFLISPAFFLSSNPYTEWRLVLLLNAMMWAGSAALLQYVLRRTHPNASVRAVTLATLGAMLYPSWLSMNGYAFSTSGFVLVFMAALAALIKSELTRPWWLALAGLLAGYLCWIHPLGVLFLGGFTALLFAQGVLKNRGILLLIGSGSLMWAGIYLLAVAPWFNRAMRGSQVNDNHYSGQLSQTLHALTTLHYWLQTGEVLVGLLLFVGAASFGIAVYGARPAVKRVWARRRDWRTVLQDAPLMATVLPLACVLGAIVITALSWGATKQLRMDQWVYGRYTDMYLLPLLGFGLLAAWRLRQAAVIAALVASAGTFLSLVTNSHNTSFVFNNKVNIQALWPMHLASVVHANYYWVWGLLGAAGIVAVGLMGTKQRKVWLTLLLFPILLAGAGNYLYSQTITRQHSTVSSLYPYIKAHYAPDDCMGFSPGGDPDERFNLYSYYLHGYDLRKIGLQQWQQAGCTGPYFTYDLAQGTQAGLPLIGREASTGLYMFASPRANAAVPPHSRYAALIFN